MKSFYFLYFVSIFCTSSILAKSLQDEKRIKKCMRIICPATETTICVKVKEQHERTRYVMMTKCELKVTRCFGDTITTVVAVKYCNNALRHGGMELDKMVSLNKNKGQADVSSTSQEGQAGLTKESDFSRPQGEDSSQGTSFIEPDASKVAPKENHESQQDLTKETDVTEMPEVDHIDEEEHTEEPELIEIPEAENDASKEDDDDEEKKKSSNNENEEESGASCPQKCPTRDVMVCAKCSHGIFRTFMSACYMRMYLCQYPKEKLELVSRHACLGSAPYLGEMPTPEKNLQEPQDNDPVLSYIFAVQNSAMY